MHEDIKAILNELCAKQNSEDLASDLIAIFEEIRQTFLEGGGDFIDFEALEAEVKEAVYVEINLLISLLKKLRGRVNKGVIAEIISKNLIMILSKHRDTSHDKARENLSRKEEEHFKKQFAETTLLELHQKYQLTLSLNKTPNPKLLAEIEEHVQKMREHNVSYKKDHPKLSHKGFLSGGAKQNSRGRTS